MLLSVRNLSKTYGVITALDNVSFIVNDYDRIGVVGMNGTGKTTLLPLSARKQQIAAISRSPLQLMSATYRSRHVGYEAEFIAKLIGYGLFRLEDVSKTVGQLSVGQRRKLEIACLLASGPNVLFLDEPTNYISLDVLEAFEAAVLNFPGPVIAVSHDRWFMQRFGGKVWEIADGRLVKPG